MKPLCFRESTINQRLRDAVALYIQKSHAFARPAHRVGERCEAVSLSGKKGAEINDRDLSDRSNVINWGVALKEVHGWASVSRPTRALRAGPTAVV
jgi:hypothetical protein